MFRDYDKAKSMLKGSFEHILGLMDKRYVSYDEIKELMVEALYKLSKENEKVETHTVTMPQVLYGPPPMEKVEHVVVERVDMPQVLYGPPPMEKVEVREVPRWGVLYGPPKPVKNEVESMLNDDYIPGTNVRKPRGQRPGETEEQYLAYLERYYATYLPNNGNGKGPRR